MGKRRWEDEKVFRIRKSEGEMRARCRPKGQDYGAASMRKAGKREGGIPIELKTNWEFSLIVLG